MEIKGKSGFNPESAHDLKAHTINQTEIAPALQRAVRSCWNGARRGQQKGILMTGTISSSRSLTAAIPSLLCVSVKLSTRM